MTDYKKLCAELLDAWDALPWQYDWKGNLIGINGYPPDDSAFERARAALAEPEPEGPTDEELADTYWTAWHEHLDRTNSVLHTVGLRAVLARWGNHPGSPDSSTPQPVPVSERWPEFSDCDDAERVWCWSWAIGTWRLSRINQSIHSHWLPAHALPQPS